MVTSNDFRGGFYRVGMLTKRCCDRGGQINDQERMGHVPKINDTNNPSGIILCYEDIVRHQVIVNNLRSQFRD